MHLLITDIKWDTDGQTLKACNLPSTVLVLDAHENADNDQNWIDNELCDDLSDEFGFCHNGFKVEKFDAEKHKFPKRCGIMYAPSN